MTAVPQDTYRLGFPAATVRRTAGSCYRGMTG